MILFSKEDSLAKNSNEIRRFFMHYLFFLEDQVNDGACLIHKGNVIPGCGDKCSALEREFSEHNSCHLNISSGDLKDSLLDNVLLRIKGRPCSLTPYEERKLKSNLEHDRVLYNGYDWQFGTAIDSIDAFEYLRCPRHENSQL